MRKLLILLTLFTLTAATAWSQSYPNTVTEAEIKTTYVNDIGIKVMKLDYPSDTGAPKSVYSPQAGEPTEISVTVHNRGKASSVPYRIQISLDGKSIFRQNAAGLFSGGEREHVVAWTAEPGSHSVRADIELLKEPLGGMGTDSTKNNTVTARVVVDSAPGGQSPSAGGDLPDLKVDGVSASTPRGTGKTILEIRIGNAGTKPSGGVNVSIKVGSSAPRTRRISQPIQPGTTAFISYEISEMHAARDDKLVIQVDPDNNVQESNESNNTYTRTL